MRFNPSRLAKPLQTHLRSSNRISSKAWPQYAIEFDRAETKTMNSPHKNLANSWQIHKWTLTWLCSIQLSTWWHSSLSRQKSHSISVQYELENIIRLKKDYKNGVSSFLFACSRLYSQRFILVSLKVFSATGPLKAGQL